MITTENISRHAADYEAPQMQVVPIRCSGMLCSSMTRGENGFVTAQGFSDPEEPEGVKAGEELTDWTGGSFW